MDFLTELKLVTSEVFINEPMSKRTTFKAGGAADYFALPRSAGEAAALIRLCALRGVDFLVLGNGSNVLFRDGGFRGVVIGTSALAGIADLGGGRVLAGAGARLRDLTAFCAAKGLTGLEFACGIPGSAGGAAAMNAGAYGAEVGERVAEVSVSDRNGDVRTLTRAEMAYGYRTSAALRDGLAVLSATFQLVAGDGEAARREMADYDARRAEKQPLDAPSAGSAFKRPEGHFAGKLIMDAGLRGFALGGAQVSEKHCGFIVNRGGATANDILRLIEHVQKVVYNQFGVALEPEVRIVGAD